MRRQPRVPPRPTVQIPYRFTPRSYQLPLLRYLEAGGRRALCVWHRRSGKDLTALNWTVACMMRRPGLYLHTFPDLVQGKRALWDAICQGGALDGVPVLDSVFPPEIALERNETETLVRTVSAGGAQSVWQMVGTDRVERLRGPGPVGVVMSEHAYQNPAAWETIEPALLANQGWAIFITTPNGRNHAHQLYQAALSNPAWFTQILTVDETRRDAPGEDGVAVVTKEDIEDLRSRGVDEEWLAQEFHCSFMGSRVGSYYGDAIRDAHKAGRITRVPWDPLLQVETWWDLGLGDRLAVWFTQTAGREIRVIQYHEGAEGEGILQLSKFLKELPYSYSGHIWPHDGAAKEISTGRSRQEQAEALGIRPVEIAPRLSVEDGISAVRALFPRFYFDAAMCEKGLAALAGYHKTWDPKGQYFRNQPAHDWSSHAADALRTGAVGTRGGMDLVPSEVKVEMKFDPRIAMGGAL